MSASIAGYRPSSIPPEHWVLIEPMVRPLVAEFQPPSPTEAQRLLVMLARHLHWCWQSAGYPLEREVVLRREVIADFVERGIPHLAPRTRATYRSRLFALADRVGSGPHHHPKPPPLGLGSAQAPYDPFTVTRLRAWADGQTTQTRRVGSTVLLALGFGAGLSSADIGPLRCRDVTVDDAGVLIHVQGKRPRSVAVLEQWEEPIAAVALAAMNRDQFVFRPNRKSTSQPKNLINEFLHRVPGRPCEVRLQRMRATWLVTHLRAGTPIRLLADAAGLDSIDALGRYLEFIPDLDIDEGRRRLREARDLREQGRGR